MYGICGVKQLRSGGKWGGSLLTKNGEDVEHLLLVEMMALSEVSGGITVDEHLMELSGELTQTVLALLGLTLQRLERIAIAQIPVG